MTIQLSTGLRNKMLDSTGFTGAFNDGVIYIYSGPQPVSADAAVQGTLLGKVTVNGGAFAFGSPTNGLGWEAAAAGVIVKETTEVWSMTGLSPGGTAGWFRLMGNVSDDLGVSTTLARLDGSVAQSGGDLNLSSTTIVIGAPTTVDTFQFTLPAS
jgi:hypothetical protein